MTPNNPYSLSKSFGEQIWTYAVTHAETADRFGMILTWLAQAIEETLPSDASTPLLPAAGSRADKLELEIRTKPGEPPFMASAFADQTVSELKQHIAKQKAGWCASGMNLVMQGRFLDNDAALGASGLKSGDFLVLTGMVPVVIEPPDTAPPDIENSLAPLSSTRFPPEATTIQRD